MTVRSIPILVLLLVLGAPASALADTLVLKDGQTFEGIVSVEGSDVSIELDIGTITFAEDEVERIERSESPVHEFDRRFAGVRRNDVPALQSLAAWADERGLTSRAYTLHAMVVAQAPKNEKSRRALGHERRDGKWVDPDEEARTALRADIKRRSQELRAAAAEQERERLLRQRAQQLARLLMREQQPAAPPAPSIWGWGPVWWNRPCVDNGFGDCRVYAQGRFLGRRPVGVGGRPVGVGGPVVFRGGRRAARRPVAQRANPAQPPRVVTQGRGATRAGGRAPAGAPRASPARSGTALGRR